VVFFRGKDGTVVATGDACPHRGGALSHGKCEFTGTITCPYHGWTFSEDGECVAVLGEGPQSRIPGMPEARVRTYPTITLKGVVWVWMGEGDPAPPEEDIPPQFFDDGVQVQNSVTIWDCNWRPACENMIDSHVFYVHRKSLLLHLTPTRLLLQMSRLGPRRPAAACDQRPRCGLQGRRSGFHTRLRRPGSQFRRIDLGPERERPRQAVATRDSYEESYPKLGGQQWPRDSWRLPWHRVVDKVSSMRTAPGPQIADEEWHDFHLPATFQVDYLRFAYSRLTVPIDKDTSRIFYFHTTRRGSTLRNLWDKVYFEVFHNWMMNYNFSGQDLEAVEGLHYDTPEHLAATDVFPMTIRRAMMENARQLPSSTSAGNRNGRS